MMRNRCSTALLSLCLLAFGHGMTHAQGISALTFPSPPGPATNLNRIVVGYDFTVTTPLTATALSFYDFTPNTPLATSHAVGLWGLGPLALAQVTVATNSPLQDSFRFVSIMPVVLLPGITYTVGALTQPDGTDPRDPFFSQVPNVSYAPGFVMGLPQTSQIDQDTLVRPMSNFGGPSLSPAFIGPSLLLQPVPEPSTLAMIVSGAGVLLVAQRRRQHRIRTA